VRQYANLDDRAWLETEYAAKERTERDIAAELGCGYSRVHEALQRHGIERRSAGRRVEHPILNDRVWLKRAYVTDGISSDGIAAIVGCDGNAVLRAFKRQGISRRRRGRQAAN
jgi:hypothetical protein